MTHSTFREYLKSNPPNNSFPVQIVQFQTTHEGLILGEVDFTVQRSDCFHLRYICSFTQVSLLQSKMCSRLVWL